MNGTIRTMVMAAYALAIIVTAAGAQGSAASNGKFHTAQQPVSASSERAPNETDQQLSISFNDATIGGQWFMSYRVGEEADAKESQFLLHRGYINVKKQLTSRLSGRITPDISVDRDGDGEGDLEMRLKYGYVDLELDDAGLFTQPHVEFGLVHRPWLDFEEHINYYRMQRTMFIERNDIINSGDFGVTLFSHLGGELDEYYQERVNKKYPGKYGSLAVGFYNGGGYHGIERNNNKTFEARLSLRPLYERFPGFQVSYHAVRGKGNTEDAPDWTVDAVYVSYENYRLVTAGMYFRGTGNMSGDELGPGGKARDRKGYSLFGELKLYDHLLSLIGRYDYFDDEPDADGGESKRIIAGISYHVKGNTKALIDYDVTTRDDWGDYTAAFWKFTMEYNF